MRNQIFHSPENEEGELVKIPGDGDPPPPHWDLYFQGFILMKNAINNQVGMLGDMFLWLLANLKQGVIYFIKQALPPNISAGSVVLSTLV